MAKKPRNPGPTPVDSIKHKDTRKNADPWDAKGVIQQALREQIAKVV